MVTFRFFFVSLLFFFVVFSAVSQLPDQIVKMKSVLILSKTLIGDDGRVYTCSDNDFFSFESNGSIAWSVHMNFKCNTDLAPVYSGLNQMLLLAENRILRVSFPRNGTKSDPELFFDPGQTTLGFAIGYRLVHYMGHCTRSQEQGSFTRYQKNAETDSVIQIEPLLDCSGKSVHVSQTKLE